MENVKKGAIISDCGKYRYALTRKWGEGFCLAFIGLNPSTADANLDDPTIRRCIGFAKSLGYMGLYMVNLFAYRATDPKQMKSANDPIGPENDKYLLRYASNAGSVIAAWGAHGGFKGQDKAVINLLKNMPIDSLGVTKGGFPKHPLYLPKTTKPQYFKTGRE